MVQAVGNLRFDVRKIGHHTVLIELSGTTMHGHYPIVAVEVGTLTLIVKFQAVCR